jgi:hypothetical protein
MQQEEVRTIAHLLFYISTPGRKGHWVLFETWTCAICASPHHREGRSWHPGGVDHSLVKYIK